MMQILDTVDQLTELVLPDDPPDLRAVANDLITLRNATEHQLAVGAAVMDRRGIANKAGSPTSTLLQGNGAPPAAACRWVRIGAGLAGLDRAGSGQPGSESLRRTTTSTTKADWSDNSMSTPRSEKSRSPRSLWDLTDTPG